MGATTSSDCPVATPFSGASQSVGQTGVSAHNFREHRRKRVTGFATLKRKFIRRRRSSKACDHARVLRDFVSDWSPLELAALYEEYEALAALKDLSVQAELARPPATTFKQDLANLFDTKICTDCDLVFRGSIFPVHRSILSSRCSYFRDLLAGCPGLGARICIELPSSPIDVQMFSSLLRYLYTGDLCQHDPTIDINILRQLSDDFGTPNPLEHDLRYLLETGDYADAALVFTSEGNDYHRPDSGSSEYGFRPKLELPCHKAILSARSQFFRNLIQRRTRNDEYTERALHVPTRIVLDETVIPKRYARILLHAIYLDTVDLTLILRGAGSGNSAGSLGEVHALTHLGRVRPTPLEEAMELYQIGRFLELDILAQGCEDLILEWLTLETLPAVLKWGSQSHGSAWVSRQACQFLREEFSSVLSSPVLQQLDKSQLICALQSNFLQASELEVLQAVLKWGEQELIRRMEDREPNLLSHTAHSVTRKGVKKRDLSDVELREILSELLPLVRMDHVLPPNNEILCQSIRRGLVSTPPSHMIGDERENLRVNAWIRGGKNQGLFVRPRLFMPYFEEVKALFEDRMASSHHNQFELMRMRRSRHLPDIPDTLYMVSRMNAGVSVSQNENNIDILTVASTIPAPDNATMQAMIKREHKLRQSPMCQRAMMLSLSSKHEINRQIRLRVVREFNLPDEVANLLERSLNNSLCAGNGNTAAAGCVDEVSISTTQTDDLMVDDEKIPPSPAMHIVSGNINSNINSRGTSVRDNSDLSASNIPHCYSRNLTFPRQQVNGGNNNNMTNNQYGRISTGSFRAELPSLITEGDYRFPSTISEPGVESANGGSNSCAEGHLSEMMPDVAMATASLGQLHLVSNGSEQQDSLHLDLGDGPSHIMGSASGGSSGLRNIQHQLPASYQHYMQHSDSPFDLHHHPNPGGQVQVQPNQQQGPPPQGSYNTGPSRYL